VVDVRGERAAARVQRGELAPHLLDDRDPTEAVGHLRGVVAPEGVVVLEEPLEGVASEEVGGHGVSRRGEGAEAGKGV
jgi:hypothetical protein